MYCILVLLRQNWTLMAWKDGMNASFITNPADGKLKRKTFKINYMGHTVKEVIN